MSDRQINLHLEGRELVGGGCSNVWVGCFNDGIVWYGLVWYGPGMQHNVMEGYDIIS